MTNSKDEATRKGMRKKTMYKKMALIAVCIVVFATCAAAQTNTFPASGNVGIGTTNPGELLEIMGSTPRLKFRNTVDGNATQTMGLISNGLSITSDAGNSLFVQRMTGNVGIGTTSPSALLQLDQAGGGNRTQKLSLPGLYNFENIYLGQYTNGNSGLEFINHTSMSNSYGVKLETNIDSNVEGLQIQVAPSASSYSALSYSTAVTVLANSGNVGIGTTNPQAKLEINGNLRFTADGSVQTTAWTGTLCGGDYAESVDVTGDRRRYAPGDVLVIDPNTPGKFLKSAEPYSTSVTGVYSTKPGTVGRRQTTVKSPEEIPMAMVGIVPAKVSAENGPIRPGDLLVTGSAFGYAMKGTDRSRMLGAVIGKALGTLDSGTGVIEVVVTLQ
jgi:hypothetical protein